MISNYRKETLDLHIALKMNVTLTAQSILAKINDVPCELWLAHHNARVAKIQDTQ